MLILQSVIHNLLVFRAHKFQNVLLQQKKIPLSRDRQFLSALKTKRRQKLEKRLLSAQITRLLNLKHLKTLRIYYFVIGFETYKVLSCKMSETCR